MTSAASGLWSDPGTWSTGKLPGAHDKVKIAAGHDVTFNVMSDAKLVIMGSGGAHTLLDLRGVQAGQEGNPYP